ncbi:MAG: ubiquinol-cytochrome c reductase iron-sulfur subunit, partial [Caldilinea sp.]
MMSELLVGQPNIDVDNEAEGESKNVLNRRQFLNITFGAVTGVSAVAIGLPAVHYLNGHTVSASAGKWVEAAQLSALDSQQVNRVTYRIRAKDAWRDIEREGVLYAYSEDSGASYVVLDATCSHLGCVVRWKPAENHFACPCHAGHFTREGAVIDGPAPHALVQLPSRIENAA